MGTFCLTRVSDVHYTNWLHTASVKGKIVGYETGDISVQAAVTVELLLGVPGLPLQAMIDQQYSDSRVMDKRPGMYLKYLPFRYDEITAKLLTGGTYAFDTWDNAKDYARWVRDDFEVGEPKTKFLKQPLFESAIARIWKIIGAHSFAPIQEHAVGRLQYWSYENADGEAILRKHYEELKGAAEKQGAAAFWLMFNPEEKLFGIQLAFKKEQGNDEVSARRSLAVVAEKPGLGRGVFEELRAKPVFDRISLFLTLWLPQSRAAGGCELLIPNYPVVPDITHDHL